MLIFDQFEVDDSCLEVTERIVAGQLSRHFAAARETTYFQHRHSQLIVANKYLT